MKINDEITQPLHEIEPGVCIQMGNDFQDYWIKTSFTSNGDMGCVDLKTGDLKVFSADTRATVFDVELRILKR